MLGYSLSSSHICQYVGFWCLGISVSWYLEGERDGGTTGREGQVTWIHPSVPLTSASEICGQNCESRKNVVLTTVMLGDHFLTIQDKGGQRETERDRGRIGRVCKVA